jgi:hypothetical protein
MSSADGLRSQFARVMTFGWEAMTTGPGAGGSGVKVTGPGPAGGRCASGGVIGNGSGGTNGVGRGVCNGIGFDSFCGGG